jgi:hypothetical protein
MRMEVCSWTKKVRVFFVVVVVTGRKKELQVAASWNQIKSNQIYIISYLHKKTSSKEFDPTHGLSYILSSAN